MMTDIDRIREALQFIDASDRETWVRTGMAIKSECGDSGFGMWEAWSQQAESFNAKDARDVWKSIRADGKVTIGTLFYEAKASGWRDDGAYQAPTPQELAERKRIAAERAAQEEAEIARERADTVKKAAAILKAATEAKADHPYLARKQVSPVATLREIDAGAAAAILGYAPKSGGEQLAGRLLVVPVKQGDGLSTLELIDGDGRKAALAGRGSKVGGYWATDRLPNDDGAGLTLLIGEGVATVLSASAVTFHPGIAALSSGNLPTVAQAMRARHPMAELVILADLVKATGEPDPHAIKAATVCAGMVAIPDFGPERDPDMTDMNDLFVLRGREAVAQAIANATPAAMGGHQPGDDDAPAGDSEGNGWPDPQPLPDELPPVEPFEEMLLPEALRGWVMDIAERMQCPPDFPAVGAITALSGLIGARAVVAPKQHDDWRVVPNLWGLIIGRPGVMKSPALAEVLKPLHMMEANERERWQAAHAAWEVDTKVAELAGKAKEKEAAAVAAKDPAKARLLLAPVEPPEEPKMRRYVVNDSTVEALAKLLVDNHWGLLVYRDEVHGLLCSMDKQGQEGSRGFYLTGYDGNQDHAVDRIERGHIYVPRVCIAMLGGIQPGKVQSYVREAVKGGASDDGLLQRFGLAVWPDINREFQLVDRWPDTDAKRAAYAVFERLNELLPATDEHPQEWRFSPEAQADFYEWLVPFEEELRGDELHPALVSHLAKWRKLIPALALIFALVDTPDADGVIQRSELRRALAWSDYLRTHAERLYAAAVIPETTGAHALLAKIKGGKLCDGDGVPCEAFTPRQVAVKHWAGLTSVEDVRKAAELLVDYGWLAKEIAPPGLAGGRPSERYLIHPALVRRKS